jgi:hypothetical protein
MWDQRRSYSIFGKQHMAGQRPAHLKPPADLPVSPPVPQPEPLAPAAEEYGGPKGEEPTRYGDWENKGICWDF